MACNMLVLAGCEVAVDEEPPAQAPKEAVTTPEGVPPPLPNGAQCYSSLVVRPEAKADVSLPATLENQIHCCGGDCLARAYARP